MLKDKKDKLYYGLMDLLAVLFIGILVWTGYSVRVLFEDTPEPTCVTGTYYLPSPDGGVFIIDNIELCGVDMELRDPPTLPSLQ